MMAALYSSALSHTTEARVFVRAVSSSISSLRYMRKSSATWSLRLLAVWSFLPTSPRREVSTCSTNMWMSSAAGSMCRAPELRSSRMVCRPSMSVSASSCVMIPLAPSIAAGAMAPVISCRAMRLSKEMEELKSSASCAVSASVRPAQSLVMIINPFLIGSLSEGAVSEAD